jgi:DNA-binding transcriptional LysR family regulator
MIQERQIEAFRAVMLTGAMTSAAEVIHVTQPAVSRLVRDLEHEIGMILFHRRGNLLLPTAEAQALLAEVERSFVGLAQISAFAQDIRTGRSGSLRIAALPAMAAGFLPRFVASFCRDRPQLRIAIDGLPSSTIRDCVTAGQFDLGVTGLRIRRYSLTLIPLDDKAVVALPAGHRLANHAVVRPDDLHDEKLVMLKKFVDSHHPIEMALQSVRHKQVVETPLSAIACVLVAEGMGIAIVDPFSASEFVGRGVVLRALEPGLQVGTGVVHSSERPLSAIAQEFLVAFLDHVHRFLERAEYLQASGEAGLLLDTRALCPQ